MAIEGAGWARGTTMALARVLIALGLALGVVGMHTGMGGAAPGAHGMAAMPAAISTETTMIGSASATLLATTLLATTPLPTGPIAQGMAALTSHTPDSSPAATSQMLGAPASGSLMMAALHACVFLVVSAILTLLAMPALQGRAGLLLSPASAVPRRFSRILHDLDRTLAFRVLRI